MQQQKVSPISKQSCLFRSKLNFNECVSTLGQLNAESFLGRFFNAQMLSEHADLLGKSGKGNESVLAGRIAKEWQRAGFSIAAQSDAAEDDDDATGKAVLSKEESSAKKRKTPDSPAVPDKSNKSKKMATEK